MRVSKLVLAAAASVAFAAIGCENTEKEASNTNVVREITTAALGPGVLAGVGGGPADMSNARTPDQATFTSAATPLGWAAEAELRESERAFANGEETTVPHSIGGGPVNLDE